MFAVKYKFEVIGVSPLIMHADDPFAGDRLSGRRSQIKSADKANFKAGDDRCPPDTWKSYLHTDGEHVTVPTDMLRACLMRGSAKKELKGKESFKKLSQSAILLDGEWTDFLSQGKQLALTDLEKINGTFVEQADAVTSLGFSLFVKRAQVGSAKHVRVRPRFDHWSCSGTLEVVDEQVTPKVLAELWQLSGFYCGLGDWRPGSQKSPGPYGRFTVKLTQVN